MDACFNCGRAIRDGVAGVGSKRVTTTFHVESPYLYCTENEPGMHNNIPPGPDDHVATRGET